MDHPRAPALSGKVSGSVLVRLDHGPHRRATMVMCRVITRHGYDQAADMWFCTVEREGRRLRVKHTMTKGVWQPV